MFHIVMHQPEIPQNTGNVMRLCANIGATLHLIEPMGFILDDKRLRRAGLDYIKRSSYQQHQDLESFFATGIVKLDRTFICTTKAQQSYAAINYMPGDCFIFGSESSGLPSQVHSSFSDSQKLLIPMHENGRSLNLANSVAIVAYEAWRQNEFICL